MFWCGTGWFRQQSFVLVMLPVPYVRILWGSFRLLLISRPVPLRGSRALYMVANLLLLFQQAAMGIKSRTQLA